MLYFALAFAVTFKLLSLVTSCAAGMVIAICAVEVAVGVPLTVMVAVVSPVRATLCVKPAGRLVIQSPDRGFAKVSLVSVTVTTVLLIALSFVPLIVTSLTAAEGTGTDGAVKTT